MSQANGVQMEGPSMQGRVKPKSDRQPILSLVDSEYLQSTANIPKAMWEPMAYLYSEAAQSVSRIEGMKIPSGPGIEEHVANLRVRVPKGGALLDVTPKPTLWQVFMRRKPTPEFKADPAAVLTVDYRELTAAEKAKATVKLLEENQVKEATLKQIKQEVAWLERLLVQSGSVEALRSWQLMTGLQQPGLPGSRPSAAVMPDFPQPQPPASQPQGGKSRRGLRI